LPLEDFSSFLVEMTLPILVVKIHLER
jgi:hypothetical protein